MFLETLMHTSTCLTYMQQGVCDDKLLLLKGVDGVFRPSVFTVRMDVSGTGKTTPIDVLGEKMTKKGRKIL